MKKISVIQWMILFVLFAFLLNACSPSMQIPTATTPPDRIYTSTATFTPRPTATLATSTPTIKQFAICPSIEQYNQYPISADDLLNGNYLTWLNSISKPFDSTKIRTDVPLIDYNTWYTIEYFVNTAPNFTGKNAGTEPFRRDRTCGVTTYQSNDYIVMPIEFYDPKHPDKNQWVITVFPLFGDYGPLVFGTRNHPTSDPTSTLEYWKKQMNITLILDSDTNYDVSSSPDPLVAASWAKYPDMQDRIKRFVNNNKIDASGDDVSALSGPIMLTGWGTTSGDWWK